MIRPTTAAMTDLRESCQIGGEEGYGNYETEDTLAPAHTIKRDGRYMQSGKSHAGVGTFWREDHNTAPTWKKLDPKSWDSKIIVSPHKKKQAPSTALSRRQSKVLDYCQGHESVLIQSVARTIAYLVLYLHRFSPGKEIATAKVVCDQYLAVFHLFSKHSDPRVKSLAKIAGYSFLQREDHNNGLDMMTSKYTPMVAADQYLALALCVLNAARSHPDARIQALENFLVRAFLTHTSIAGVEQARLWVEQAIAYNVNILAARR